MLIPSKRILKGTEDINFRQQQGKVQFSMLFFRSIRIAIGCNIFTACYFCLIVCSPSSLENTQFLILHKLLLMGLNEKYQGKFPLAFIRAVILCLLHNNACVHSTHCA